MDTQREDAEKFSSSSHRMNPLTGRWVRIGGRTETKLRRAEFLVAQHSKSETISLPQQQQQQQQRRLSPTDLLRIALTPQPRQRKRAKEKEKEKEEANDEEEVAAIHNLNKANSFQARNRTRQQQPKQEDLWSQNGF